MRFVFLAAVAADPEEVGDHRDGQRKADLGHQVALPTGRDLVDEIVDHRSDQRQPLGDHAGQERLVGDLTLPPVRRCVGGEQHAVRAHRGGDR